MCKFVCATTSKKPINGLLPWVIVQATWCQKEHLDKCSFAQVILAQLYNSLSVLADSRLPLSLSIPYWLLDSYIKAFFEDTHKTINHAKQRTLKHEVSTDEFIEYLINKDGICSRETDEEWFCFGDSFNGNPQWDIIAINSNNFVLGN